MSNGTVGVTQGSSPDRQIDNDVLTVGGSSVYRQRVNVVPAAASSYYAGVSGSVNVPTTEAIVSVSCACTTAATVTIAGGATITVPAEFFFFEELHDAPIVGVGAGSLVFTDTDTYFVRTRPVVA